MDKIISFDKKYIDEADVWSFKPSECVNDAINVFKQNKVKQILLPAFGYGRNAIPFIENGFDVVATEVSDEAISIAKRNQINCKIVKQSIFEPDFHELFDGIFTFSLIHLFEDTCDQQQIVKNLINLLKKNGIIYAGSATNNNQYKSCNTKKYGHSITSFKELFNSNLIEIIDCKIISDMLYYKDNDKKFEIVVLIAKKSVN